MASPPETLDDLLRQVIDENRLTEWCRQAGIAPWTLLRLRTGRAVRVHTGTVRSIARKLRLLEQRVRAAIAASRKP